MLNYSFNVPMCALEGKLAFSGQIKIVENATKCCVLSMKYSSPSLFLNEKLLNVTKWKKYTASFLCNNFHTVP